MKFKVGQVWEDGNGEQVEIKATNSKETFLGVDQSIWGVNTEGEDRHYTKDGFFGLNESYYQPENLTRLISEPAGEAEPAESGEADTPPVTLELMQEFTAADTELCELAKGLQDRGAMFEMRGGSTMNWCSGMYCFDNDYSSYRMVSPPPTDDSHDVPTKRRLKLMIVGHGRHGKDTVAQILADELGLTFCSSSYFCAKAFIYDALKNVFGYRSIAECYEARNRNQRMRDLWHTLICAYNKDDPARLSREILSEYDIYVGIRSDEEFATAEEEGLFDLSIWVDASRRLDPEGESSFEINRADCDIVIDNNESEDDLVRRVTRLASVLDVSQ